MGKLEKKRNRLNERIRSLENQLQASLVQKVAMKMEIDVSALTQKIIALRKELSELK